MKSEAHILIVDDDEAIRDLLHEFLKKRGMHVSVARDGEEMQEVLSRSPIDLLILDVMLPGKSGMEICRDIRMHSRIPIIMLTAVTETTDRVVGLEMGADDYVSKPFDPRELLARVRAVLRRLDTSGPDRRLEPTIYKFAGWTMDCSRRRLVSPDAVRVELTTAEFNLLETLVKSAQRMLSRDQLLELVGNNAAYGYDRSIDILISRLRRKMKMIPSTETDSDDPGRRLSIRSGSQHGMKRFLPQSLPSWILLILIAGLLTTQVATLSIVSRDRTENNNVLELFRLSERAYTLVKVLYAAPASDRSLLASALSNSANPLSMSDEPAVTSAIASDDSLAELEDVLVARLTAFGVTDARIHHISNRPPTSPATNPSAPDPDVGIVERQLSDITRRISAKVTGSRPRLSSRMANG